MDQNNQIVVATEQLPLVQSVLRAGGLTAIIGDPDDEPRIGLSLVHLVEVDRLARDLRERAEKLNRPAAVPAPQTDGDLDRVLYYLRWICEDGYAGWSPTVGKNRTMTGVQFKPYPNAGGDDDPKPAEAPDLPRVSRRSGDPVRVGVLDTPLYPHPVLTGRYVAEDDALIPEHGIGRWWWLAHSAFISSLVLQKAPAAQLDVRTPLHPEDSEAPDDWEMPVWELARRIVDFRDSGVRVLNLSLGTITRDGKPPLVLDRAIAQLTPSVVVVAAAGNHGLGLTDADRRDEDLPEPDAVMWPAALDGVVAVGALDGDRAPASFNPRNGKHPEEVAPWIDLLAPGVNVRGAYFGGSGRPERVRLLHRPGRADVTSDEFRGGAEWSGTSFSAATVTGAIASRIQQGESSQEALDGIRKGQDPLIRRP
jgi:membrane-anchored mycosin MYCP